jgi:hypothetical protein
LKTFSSLWDAAKKSLDVTHKPVNLNTFSGIKRLQRATEHAAVGHYSAHGANVSIIRGRPIVSVDVKKISRNFLAIASNTTVGSRFLQDRALS